MTRLLMLLVLELFSVGSSAYASDADDNYNFSWLDPEKKIYVLQNRRYRKAEKVHLTAMVGTGISETYRSVYQVQPRLGYWFNEDFGIEGFYSARFNSPNNAFKALVDATGTGSGTPYIREVQSEVGVLFNWAPWYAKINVFNSILYFDWYFSLGAGSLMTQVGPKSKDDAASAPYWKNENLFAIFLGTGHMFHLSDQFSIRLDFLSHFYSAAADSGAVATSGSTVNNNKSIFANYTFGLGLGLKL